MVMISHTFFTRNPRRLKSYSPIAKDDIKYCSSFRNSKDIPHSPAHTHTHTRKLSKEISCTLITVLEGKTD